MTESLFEKESVMVVFTTSPAGLGHVRVMQALKGGLPDTLRSEIIGIEDPQIQFLHRITSRNHRMLHILEFMQTNPFVEDLFTRWYRQRLRTHAEEVYKRLTDLISRRRPKPKVVVVVSTHVSLGHQIAAIKETLEMKTGVKILLAVVVTDDTKQKIWGVFGSDLLVVPSAFIAEWMRNYLNTIPNINMPKIVVSAYPVSSQLQKRLGEEDFERRKKQVVRNGKRPLKIMVPVSGAAVQLNYLKEIISSLSKKSIAEFTVISRESPYTKGFLDWCQTIASVEVFADRHDWEVVASCEHAYRKHVYAVEVTKPSEQAFKVLLDPTRKGGVIMLFSTPVGGQEYDNVAFLKRHNLVPSDPDGVLLERLYKYNDRTVISAELLDRAKSWRGIMLPKDAKVAATAIRRLRNSGIFRKMIEYTKKENDDELSNNGTQNFWETIEQEVNKNL